MKKDIEFTEDQIAELFKGTNFGSTSETHNGRVGLMVESVFKHAAGYFGGKTISGICCEAGLLKGNLRNLKPNKAALRWAFHQIYCGSITIIERLAKKS